jgi:hypothetical protein
VNSVFRDCILPSLCPYFNSKNHFVVCIILVVIHFYIGSSWSLRTLTAKTRFDIFTVVKIQVEFFWVETSCSVAVGY